MFLKFITATYNAGINSSFRKDINKILGNTKDNARTTWSLVRTMREIVDICKDVGYKHTNNYTDTNLRKKVK